MDKRNIKQFIDSEIFSSLSEFIDSVDGSSRQIVQNNAISIIFNIYFNEYIKRLKQGDIEVSDFIKNYKKNIEDLSKGISKVVVSNTFVRDKSGNIYTLKNAINSCFKDFLIAAFSDADDKDGDIRFVIPEFEFVDKNGEILPQVKVESKVLKVI